jgi:hypothetical protein
MMMRLHAELANASKHPILTLPLTLAHQVVERLGLSVTSLLTSTASPVLCSWGEAHMHRLVASFLAARFPILLALNKVGRMKAVGVVFRLGFSRNMRLYENNFAGTLDFL